MTYSFSLRKNTGKNIMSLNPSISGVRPISRRGGLILAAKGLAALALPSIITGKARAEELEPVERHVVPLRG
jgi:hypothetical protein